MGYVTTSDGARIFYQGWGTGRPVVLSHGWPLNSDSWEAQALFLAGNGYRVIAHDRRGHGRSTRTWDGNDMDTYADDLAALVEFLGLAEATLVGFSDTEAGRRTFRIDRVSSADPTDDPVHRPEDFDLAESWHEIADQIDRKRMPLEIQAVCAPHGISLLRMGLGSRLQVGGSTSDGRVEVLIRGHNEYVLAGELAGLVEWLEVTGPPGVRDHLASIGNALAERHG